MREADEFMTVAEMAAILKLNQQTVRNWIDAGSSRRSTSAGASASSGRASIA